MKVWEILLFFLIANFYKSHAERYCRLPRGPQYERAIYRPFSDWNTQYAEGQIIRSRAKVRVICKKDVLHDAITDSTVSKCVNRRWIPELPSCVGINRCQAPPRILDATASEQINPYITFPHGTTVTYICNAGKMPTGNGQTVCEDGTWSKFDFKCLEATTQSTEPPTPVPEITEPKPRECTVAHGRVVYLVLDYYQVTCDVGFRLRGLNLFRCQAGIWTDEQPTCSRALRTYRDCTVPDWTEDGAIFVGADLDGHLVERQAGDSVEHGDAVQIVCAENFTSLESHNSKDGEDIAFCLNGRWEPDLRPCSDNLTDIDEGNYTDDPLPNETTVQPMTPEFFHEDNTPTFYSVYPEGDENDSFEEDYREAESAKNDVRESEYDEDMIRTDMDETEMWATTERTTTKTTKTPETEMKVIDDTDDDNSDYSWGFWRKGRKGAKESDEDVDSESSESSSSSSSSDDSD